MKPGDYIMPHTDLYRHENVFRRVAFVIHLSKDWDVSYGGDFVWCNPHAVVPPRCISIVALTSRLPDPSPRSYNTMVLFPVSPHSCHWVRCKSAARATSLTHARYKVSPVFKGTPPTLKRLAVSGWWMSSSNTLEQEMHDLDDVLRDAIADGAPVGIHITADGERVAMTGRYGDDEAALYRQRYY
jgi:Rps23 Pro-64 3,4-dihydroxylase Tpa1-like proline 4-hydroxylase